MSLSNQGKSAGFTLIEMVTVILILGIVVVGLSSFVIFGTRIFCRIECCGSSTQSKPF